MELKNYANRQKLNQASFEPVYVGTYVHSLDLRQTAKAIHMYILFATGKLRIWVFVIWFNFDHTWNQTSDISIIIISSLVHWTAIVTYVHSEDFFIVSLSLAHILFPTSTHTHTHSLWFNSLSISLSFTAPLPFLSLTMYDSPLLLHSHSLYQFFSFSDRFFCGTQGYVHSTHIGTNIPIYIQPIYIQQRSLLVRLHYVCNVHETE
jgi:hypothetical protein